MVAGFAQSSPNEVLMRFADAVRAGREGALAVDIGCGAARNAVPLARVGWRVVGTDFSWPMLVAARDRAMAEGVAIDVALAPMERLPLADRTADLIVAHGVWNLARSTEQFRTAVREAARVARPGAALFVFTFSRATLPAHVPALDPPFVYTQFSGEPQCFLTEDQLIAEMRTAGFELDPRVPLTEYNRPVKGPRVSGPPVIYEAGFYRVS